MIRAITVNYHQPIYTVQSVKSLLLPTVSDLKILVIDNGSDDEEHKLLVDMLPESVDVFWSRENIGYVNAVNHGLKVALTENADYALVINNDTEIDPEAVLNLIECAQKFSDKCIVSGKVFHFNEPGRFQSIGSVCVNKRRLRFYGRGRNEFDTGQYDYVTEVDMLDDIFWLIPSDLIRKVGYYNPLFWFNAEQADYALRAVNNGFKLIYTPRAKIWHKGSLSIGGRTLNPILQFWDSQSYMLLKYLHLSKSAFILDYLSAIFYSLLLLIFRGVIKRDRDGMRVVWIRLRGQFSIWRIINIGINDGRNPYVSKTINQKASISNV